MHRLTGTVCLPDLRSTRRRLSLARPFRLQAISVWTVSTWWVLMIACDCPLPLPPVFATLKDSRRVRRMDLGTRVVMALLAATICLRDCNLRLRCSIQHALKLLCARHATLITHPFARTNPRVNRRLKQHGARC